MTGNNKLVELEKTIIRFYECYSAKRVALATFLVGLISLAGALVVYWLFANGLIAALVGFFVGFVALNVAFMTIVPPASSLSRVSDLICAAIKDPSRIKSYDMQKVQVADSRGKVQTLGARELSLWKSVVVPYLIECQAQGQAPARRKSSRTLTASERNYIEQRRKEVLEMEQKIEEERKSLEQDRLELKVRGNDLKQAEELVIARLTGVEQAEAEVEQLKIVAAERADVAAAAYDAKAAEAKAAELRAKETELSELKKHLAEDRQNFENQEAELQRLQTTVTRTPFAASKESSSEQSLEARESALAARMKQLEEEAHSLEARASFVTESENSLIERLDALSHREATIEQGEIDAGLRKD